MSKPYDATLKDLMTKYPADWLTQFGIPFEGSVEVSDSSLSTITADADKIMVIQRPEPCALNSEGLGSAGGEYFDGRSAHSATGAAVGCEAGRAAGSGPANGRADTAGGGTGGRRAALERDVYIDGAAVSGGTGWGAAEGSEEHERVINLPGDYSGRPARRPNGRGAADAAAGG